MDETELKKTVAGRISFYRRRQGLTQLELAEKLHYSDKSVSKWERGEGLPDVCVLCSMAELFGVSVDALLHEMPVSGRADGKKRSVRIFVPLLSFGLVWLTGSVIFVVYRLLMQFFPALNTFDARLVFLYCVPVSFIVLTVFACLWGNRLLQGLAVSGIVWTVPLGIFLTFQHEVSQQTFIIAAVLQVLVVLWFTMRHKISKSES